MTIERETDPHENPEAYEDAYRIRSQEEIDTEGLTINDDSENNE